MKVLRQALPALVFLLLPETALACMNAMDVEGRYIGFREYGVMALFIITAFAFFAVVTLPAEKFKGGYLLATPIRVVLSVVIVLLAAAGTDGMPETFEAKLGPTYLTALAVFGVYLLILTAFALLCELVPLAAIGWPDRLKRIAVVGLGSAIVFFLTLYIHTTA